MLEKLVEDKLKRWLWIVILISFVLIAGFLGLVGLIGVSFAGYPQPIQDRLDQRALWSHFDLPIEPRLVEYDGYPPVVGFGQREGLAISAVYQLSPDQVELFKDHALAKGWEPLPVPVGLKNIISPYVDEHVLEISSGFYLCRTAGHNVLHAPETKPCLTSDFVIDAVYGAFDADTNRLYLQVSSGY